MTTKKLQILIIGHLLKVGGTPEEPVATFAQCNADGEPCLGAKPILVPLDSEADARRLGAALYTNFAITLEQCDVETLLGDEEST